MSYPPSARWAVRYTERALTALQGLDRPIREQIEGYAQRLLDSDAPRSRGRALSGPLVGLWRYRVGDHRLICEIQDDVLVILVIDIGHRSKIYRRQ